MAEGGVKCDVDADQLEDAWIAAVQLGLRLLQNGLFVAAEVGRELRRHLLLRDLLLDADSGHQNHPGAKFGKDGGGRVRRGNRSHLGKVRANETALYTP